MNYTFRRLPLNSAQREARKSLARAFIAQRRADAELQLAEAYFSLSGRMLIDIANDYLKECQNASSIAERAVIAANEWCEVNSCRCKIEVTRQKRRTKNSGLLKSIAVRIKSYLIPTLPSIIPNIKMGE